MNLHDFLNIYGFHGKRNQPSNPKAVCWYIAMSNIDDLVGLFLSRVPKNDTVSEILNDFKKDDSLSKYKSLYLPIQVTNPHNPARYNCDILYFEMDYNDNVGRSLNATHPSLFVFVKSSKTQQFEDCNMFATFEECAAACEKFNKTLYKNTIGMSIKYLDLYCTCLKICQKNLRQLEEVSDGHN